MTTATSPTGDLTLGHILESAGLDLSQVVIVRHTYTQTGLRSPADLTPENLLTYTRGQDRVNKLGKEPGPLWLVFMADGARRSRLVTAYENHGEVEAEGNADYRYFDLRESDALVSLRSRLVVEWSGDTVNWAKVGSAAAAFPVVEIADPEKVPFPGYDFVRVSHDELQDVVGDPRYVQWQTALGSVKGIYVITDTSTGKVYVGKADGAAGVLGRWSQYAKDGTGGNHYLRELAGLDSEHPRHYQYSLLKVFAPSALVDEVNASEEHYKRVLLSRKFGLN